MRLTQEQYIENLHSRIEKLEEALQLMCDAVTEHPGSVEDCERCQGYTKAVKLWNESNDLQKEAA